jgi:hypothetical protein
MPHAKKYLNAGKQKHEDGVPALEARYAIAASLLVAWSSNLQFAPALS